MSTNPQVPAPDHLAGRYRIDGRLDAGATSVVYRAFDTRLRRPVAIKVLDARFSGNVAARVLREARAASTLGHPNVCTVFEVDEAGGQPFIVMEQVAGKRLDRAIPPGVGLPCDTVLEIGGQIADGLSHAHEQGVLHRDLKPANVVIGVDGRPKILDFGLALERERTAGAETESEEADPGIAGTPGYMAPEVLSGAAPDTRSDIWALGVVLFEMAVGERPFPGRTSYEIASAVLSGRTGPMPARVPAGLRAIIERCLQVDPARRYQRAAEVRAALDAVRVGGVVGLPRWRFRRTASLVAVGVLAAVALSVVYVARAIPSHDLQTIAVVPVVAPGAPADVAYLADGIAGSVIDTLAELPDPRLNVIALSSVLRYKGSRIDIEKVERELHPGNVLTLRVGEHESMLSVDAELIAMPNNKHLWGERFEAQHSSLALMPDRLAARISESLRIELSKGQREHLRKRYSANGEAYRLYLLGRRAWELPSPTPDGYERSLDYYQQAIAKDPEFALAYVGLADTYVSLAYDGWQSPGDAYEPAQKAMEKAIALDPALAEFHLTLAGIRWGRDWDWPGAAREYERALAMSPGYVEAHRFYAVFLRAMGRLNDALRENKRALDLDPLGVQTNMTLGATYHWQHREADAIDQYRRTLELDPDSAAVHDLLADAFERVNRDNDALAHRQLALRLAGEDLESALLGREAAALGYQAAMRQYYRRSLDRLLEARQRAYVAPMAVAITAIGADDKDVAFEWLNRACDERHPWVTMVKMDPAFDPIRRDPRFSALVTRIGLPE